MFSFRYIPLAVISLLASNVMAAPNSINISSDQLAAAGKSQRNAVVKYLSSSAGQKQLDKVRWYCRWERCGMATGDELLLKTPRRQPASVDILHQDLVQLGAMSSMLGHVMWRSTVSKVEGKIEIRTALAVPTPQSLPIQYFRDVLTDWRR